MRFINALTFSSILFSFNVFALSENDPFKNMSFHTLDNGMKVVLAPNQNAKNMRVKLVVGYGRIVEKRHELQAGHVLEHMLFKDGTISENKSYLEIIKEAGGDVNAYVTGDHTAYHTTIPAERGEWLIDKFKSMLFFRKLDEQELKLGKASVVLEIGKPFIFNRWLKANPLGFFVNNYFPEKDFWQTEFGMPDFPYSRENERLNVNELKLSQIKHVYDNYYYPSNMTLFVAGKFSPGKLIGKLNKEFADIPDKKGLKMPQFRAQSKGGDFIKTSPSIDGDVQGIAYGRKLFNRSIDEVMAADAYYNYIAHRLMIELRNKKGETYTAHSSISYEKNAGWATVSFKTPSEAYEKNKNFLLNLIDKEAIQAKISDEDVKKAIDLFLKERYEITDTDAESNMKMAELYLEFREDFKETRSPFTILSSMSPDSFRKHIQNVHKEEKVYMWETVNPLFFAYDLFVLLFVSIMGGIMLFKTLWNNKKESVQMTWVQKASTTPGMLFEVVTMLPVAFLIQYLIFRPLDSFIETQNFYRGSVFISSYLDTFVGTVLYVGLLMYLMKNFTSKVYSTGRELVIHQFILQESYIPYSDIASFETVSFFKKYDIRLLWKSKFSLNPFIDIFSWRKALLVNLKDGTTYLLFVKDAEALAKAMRDDINKLETPNNENIAA